MICYKCQKEADVKDNIGHICIKCLDEKLDKNHFDSIEKKRIELTRAINLVNHYAKLNIG